MKQTLLLFFLCLTFQLTLSGQSGPFGQDADLYPPEDRILIYPNPAVDFIELTGNMTAVEAIAIYSMVGRQVQRFDVVPGERYQVGSLPNGMYLVQVLDNSNKVLYTHRMNKRS
jgi:hypothetical protein